MDIEVKERIDVLFGAELPSECMHCGDALAEGDVRFCGMDCFTVYAHGGSEVDSLSWIEPYAYSYVNSLFASVIGALPLSDVSAELSTGVVESLTLLFDNGSGLRIGAMLVSDVDAEFVVHKVNNALLGESTDTGVRGGLEWRQSRRDIGEAFAGKIALFVAKMARNCTGLQKNIVVGINRGICTISLHGTMCRSIDVLQYDGMSSEELYNTALPYMVYYTIIRGDVSTGLEALNE